MVDERKRPAAPVDGSEALMRERLAALAAWLPVFGSSDLVPGTFAPMRRNGDMSSVGSTIHASEVDAFVLDCYSHDWVDPTIDWGEWKQTPEARRFLVKGAIGEASVQYIACLLTTFIRQDRFAEGALLEAFRAGYIAAIVARAGQLAELQGSAPPSS